MKLLCDAGVSKTAAHLSRDAAGCGPAVAARPSTKHGPGQLPSAGSECWCRIVCHQTQFIAFRRKIFWWTQVCDRHGTWNVMNAQGGCDKAARHCQRKGEGSRVLLAGSISWDVRILHYLLTLPSHFSSPRVLLRPGPIHPTPSSLSVLARSTLSLSLAPPLPQYPSLRHESNRCP